MNEFTFFNIFNLKGNYKEQLVIDNIENYNIKNVAKSFLNLSE